jgi:hypothetical protein
LLPRNFRAGLFTAISGVLAGSLVANISSFNKRRNYKDC